MGGLNKGEGILNRGKKGPEVRPTNYKRGSATKRTRQITPGVERGKHLKGLPNKNKKEPNEPQQAHEGDQNLKKELEEAGHQ